MARTKIKPTGRPKGPPNPAYHRPDGVTEITLTRSMVALIDTANYELVEDYRWYSHCNGDCCYARASFPLPLAEDGKRRRGNIMMHRLLLPNTEFIDHRNHNGLDNRMINIRAATSSENAFNRIKNKHGKFCKQSPSSKYVGVTYCNSRGDWTATINRIRIGSFKTEEEAWQARQQAEKIYHPTFERGTLEISQ